MSQGGSTRHPQHSALGAGPEFDAIRRLISRWGPRARGLGDDAAVIAQPLSGSLVVSTDTSVEHVHFRRDWLSPSEIGYRAAAAALSDLAAMAAAPLGMFCSLTLTETWFSEIDELADGIGEAAEALDIPILGGDTTRGGELSLTFTVLGTAQDLLLRTAARPGDRVYLTGTIGGSLAALRDLQNGQDPSPADRMKFARPIPRIREAIWLRDNGAAAGIDISDGLAADLGHVAAASNLHITIDVERLPVANGVIAVDAVASGEEYEIAVTSPVELNCGEFAKKFDVQLTEIGRVGHGPAELRLLLGGVQVDAAPGFQHFGRTAE